MTDNDLEKITVLTGVDADQKSWIFRFPPALRYDHIVDFEPRIQALSVDACEVKVDLGAVQQLDSAGLGYLAYVKNKVETAGGRFTLVNIPGKIMDECRDSLSDHFSLG